MLTQPYMPECVASFVHTSVYVRHACVLGSSVRVELSLMTSDYISSFSQESSVERTLRNTLRYTLGYLFPAITNCHIPAQFFTTSPKWPQWRHTKSWLNFSVAKWLFNMSSAWFQLSWTWVQPILHSSPNHICNQQRTRWCARLHFLPQSAAIGDGTTGQQITSHVWLCSNEVSTLSLTGIFSPPEGSDHVLAENPVFLPMW